MALIFAYKNRGLTRDFVMTDKDGAVIVPGANDAIRVIIGHEGKLKDSTDLSDAELLVTDTVPTANGTTFTKGTSPLGLNRLRLDASDLTFPAGVYTLIFDFFDSTDASEWKNVSRQVFSLEES